MNIAVVAPSSTLLKTLGLKRELFTFCHGSLIVFFPDSVEGFPFFVKRKEVQSHLQFRQECLCVSKSKSLFMLLKCFSFTGVSY